MSYLIIKFNFFDKIIGDWGLGIGGLGGWGWGPSAPTPKQTNQPTQTHKNSV